jgi:NAD(P)-dependent dehydrogenase (short-subunit alcohol dehydrogenase family)
VSVAGARLAAWLTLPNSASRSALITAGTRGIGKAIADRLRAGGARVLVAARSVPDGASDDVIAADVSIADGWTGLSSRQW